MPVPSLMLTRPEASRREAPRHDSRPRAQLAQATLIDAMNAGLTIGVGVVLFDVLTALVVLRPPDHQAL